MPPEVIFLKRFVKFFFDNLESDNNVINYIFRSAIKSNSRLGSNYRYIMHKFDISLNADIIDRKSTSNKLCNMILEQWNLDLSDDDKREGEHIIELVKRRDSLDHWILNKKEIQDVIEMLSTG